MSFMTIGLHSTQGHHYIHRVHDDTLIVAHGPSERQLARVIVENGRGDAPREALFFVSVRASDSGRPIVRVTTKTQEGVEKSVEVMGKWWDTPINRAEVTAKAETITSGPAPTHQLKLVSSYTREEVTYDQTQDVGGDRHFPLTITYGPAKVYAANSFRMNAILARFAVTGELKY